MAGVAAPQPGGLVDGDVAVHVAHPVPRAPPVGAGEARIALGARHEDLDGDAVAGVDIPALTGAGAHLLDDADGLVARDEREAGGESAGVLLVIGAAEP